MDDLPILPVVLRSGQVAKPDRWRFSSFWRLVATFWLFGCGIVPLAESSELPAERGYATRALGSGDSFGAQGNLTFSSVRILSAPLTIAEAARDRSASRPGPQVVRRQRRRRIDSSAGYGPSRCESGRLAARWHIQDAPAAPWLAYIDPGSGSMILQYIIAGVVGTAAYFRKFIFGMFKKRREEPVVVEEPKDKPSPE